MPRISDAYIGTLFTEYLPWLKGEDLEWVMGRGVCEWPGRR